jgi:membrane protease YdiL (CAAX protease family)
MILGPVLNLVLEPFGFPFHTVMSRALLISALAALILFRRHLRLRQWWPSGAIAWRQMGFGFLLAVVSAQAMIGLYLAFCGFESAHLSFIRAIRSILTAIVASLIVPVLEETIFRGFLVSILAKALGRWAGWFLAAFLFALAHFLKVPSDVSRHSNSLWSGVAGIVSIFTHLGQGDFFTGRGLNLFLVGLILGGIFLRAGTLWVNAALHSGWIMILMSFSAFARTLNPPRAPWLGKDLLSSPLTSAVLLLLGLWLWRYYQVASNEADQR